MGEEVSKSTENIEILVTQLEENNITHEEHGPAGGFHEAEEVKNSTCAYIRNLLSLTRLHYDRLSTEGVNQSLDIIREFLTQIEKLATSIHDITSEQNRAKPEYPAQRKTIITAIKKLNTQLKTNLRQFNAELKIADLEAGSSIPEDIKNILADVDRDRKKISDLAKQAEKGVSGIQSKVISEGVQVSNLHFDTLRRDHESFEKTWLIIFGISSIITIVTAIYAILSPIGEIGSIESLIIVIRKVLLVLIPATFMKISLSKYNVERNLRIIYSHRQAVLAQFEYFEKGIGDDVPSKNELRLQVARYIFTDPETGYLGKDKGANDININPLMVATEKILPKP